MSRDSFAPGKVILSGEYAVLFGYPGIAVPSTVGINVVFEEDSTSKRVEVLEEGYNERLLQYVERIVAIAQKYADIRGRLIVRSNLPLGKGMGSSTALIIAVVRAILGDDARDAALEIEDILNLGHSGLDFESIWRGVPVLFRKGVPPIPIDLPRDLLQGATLIDTGLPNESTAELVAWVRSREGEVTETLRVIGNCTERLAGGEPLCDVMRDHNKAQVALSVVPPGAQELIAAIEWVGGAAKVIGAGARTGGAGMVLALGDQEKIRSIADERNMPTMMF